MRSLHFLLEIISSIKQEKKKVISTVIFIFWSNFEGFIKYYHSFKNIWRFSFWITSPPSLFASIMILLKKHCENWTRITLSELLENCLQESFEISYSREFIWQKFLQIRYQFIQIEYNRIPIIWILMWEKVGLSGWLKTGKNVFKMLTWTLNLYF